MTVITFYKVILLLGYLYRIGRHVPDTYITVNERLSYYVIFSVDYNDVVAVATGVGVGCLGNGAPDDPALPRPTGRRQYKLLQNLHMTCAGRGVQREGGKNEKNKPIL